MIGKYVFIIYSPPQYLNMDNFLAQNPDSFHPHTCKFIQSFLEQFVLIYELWNLNNVFLSVTTEMKLGPVNSLDISQFTLKRSQYRRSFETTMNAKPQIGTFLTSESRH